MLHLSARSSRPKLGFTLIELLVVIAIIAILAAILFPVFAQAKLAAKKATGVSNVKQIALASVMYDGDNDDTSMPLFFFDPNNPQYPSTTGVYFWPVNMLPYTKSEKVYLDPQDTSDDPTLDDPQGHTRFDPNNIYHYLVVGLAPSYGFNGSYLSPNVTDTGLLGYHPQGVPLSSISSTASTVEFAESTGKDYSDPLTGATATNPIGTNQIYPPSGWNSSVTYPNATSQGQLWGRYDPKKVIVGWLDGHVKFTAISALVGPTTSTTTLDEYWNGTAN